METVCYNSLNPSLFNHVYEPAEDSFLLIDALEKDLDLIRNLAPLFCLEVGSGSGVVISSLAKVLSNRSFYFSTDINKHAALATKIVSTNNGLNVETIVSDMLTPFQDRLKNSIDLLIFNPPYGVTPSCEIKGDGLQRATSGGKNGREVMDRFFPIVPKVLSSKGLFYMICKKENNIADIKDKMEAYNLKMLSVLDRKCGIEHLYALRFSFKSY